MKHEKFISVLYLLGFALVMGASIYFFAANWQWVPHWGRLGLSIGITLAFYCFAYVFNSRHHFLPQWLLFLGACGFGVSVALIGQIYNSHADSYLLFLTWSIPALLFAIVTRYQPFYILSYVLVHMTLHFMLFPTGLHFYYEPMHKFLIFALFFGLNSLLFWLILKERLQSSFLRYVSLIGVLGYGIYLTDVQRFQTYGIIASLLYVGLLALFFYLTLKKWQDKGLALITFIASVIYVSYKYFDYLIRHASDSIFLMTLLFVPVLVGVNVWFMRYLSRRMTQKQTSASPTQQSEASDTQSKHNQSEWNHMLKDFLQRALVGAVTFIASLLGTVAIIGYLGITFNLGENLFILLFYMGLSFIILAVCLRYFSSFNPTISYTLLLIGFALGIPAAIVKSSLLYAAIYLGVVALAWYSLAKSPMKVVAHGFFMLALYLYGVFIGRDTLLSGLSSSAAHDAVLLTLIGVNLLLLILSEARVRLFANGLVSLPALGFTHLFLLVLTNVRESLDLFYFIINGAYFIGATWAIFYFLKLEKLWLYRLSLGAWFLFLVFKYHEFLWHLLHKSLTLLILGMLVLVAARLLEVKREKSVSSEHTVSFLTKKKALIIGIIVLQLLLLGYQIGKSELQLANGTEIKLELAPVDPRSLMQGDYIILDYHIANVSTLPSSDLTRNERVEVVLRPNLDGIYQSVGYYKYRGNWNRAYQPLPGDIIIRGKFNGYNRIYYGIEHYFVPENTGRELEQVARFAYVNVAANGDAILLKLTEE